MGKPLPSELHEADIRAELERILASAVFSQSDSLQRFLRYVVERTLAGEADELKEYNVGVDVLGRGEAYDPRTDTIVRVQAGRLRSKLQEYYQDHGSRDPVRIEIPKGAYVPSFRYVSVEGPGSETDVRRRIIPWVGAILLAFLGALGVWWLYSTDAGEPVSLQSIAVLPFADMSPNQDQEYFADGVAEELTNTLSHLQGIYVAPRTSSFQFKGERIGIQQIGERLGVDAVVQGSVRKSEDNLRVTAQLIRASDGDNLWSATYDRTEGDVFSIQEELARAITNALQVPLLYNAREYWTDRYTEDPEIYELYLKGRHRLNRGEEADVATAVDLFEDVLARDGDYAPAYAGLVDAYARLAFLGLASPPEVEEQAERAAERAVALDTNLPDAQLALAAYRILFRWDWQQGERAVRRALELDPASARAHEWYAHLLIATGRLDEGLAEARRARELEQLSPSPATTVALALYLKRDYRQAQEECQGILRWAPGSQVTRVILGLAQKQQSRFDEAIAAFQELERTSGNAALALSFEAHTYALAGREEEARNRLDELKGLAELRYVAPSYFARVHLGLHENDIALDWLEAAAQNRSLPVATIKSDPDMDPLRGEPRFRKLLAAAGLE
jgi:TolB-like protein/Flp pilus assembly protein TadD